MRERWFPLLALLVAFAVLVFLANQFDAVALTAPGTFRQMLILGSPILLAGLDGLYCERAGIINIGLRSEEHTSELQSLIRIPYAVFSFNKTTNHSLIPN